MALERMNRSSSGDTGAMVHKGPFLICMDVYNLVDVRSSSSHYCRFSGLEGKQL